MIQGNNKSKFNLSGFDSIAKVNKDIHKNEVMKNKETSKDTKQSLTQEIDLSSLGLKNKSKDLKVQKSLALKKSTIERLDKLAKRFGTSTSDIADKAIRTILELDN